MTQEEKLEEAKRLYESANADQRYVLESLFPELKESEGERMMRVLIGGLKSYVDMYSEWYDGVSTSEIIAWLEKQCKHNSFSWTEDDEAKVKAMCEEGNLKPSEREWLNNLRYRVTEKNPTNKVEPKFKVGDIVKHKDNPYLTYILKRFTDDGDYEFHAIGKDGNEGCTCFSVVKYQDEWELVEQKPTVEIKTPEESLGVDSDTYNKIVDECVYGEQKSAWSEEEEKKQNYLIALLQNSTMNNPAFRSVNEGLEEWLKSLKERVQPKQELSEEDECIVTELIGIFESAVDGGYVDIPYRLIKDYIRVLKSCLPQTTWKPSDEQMTALNYVVNLMASSESPVDNDYYYNVFKDLREQLKKLREE